MFGCVEPKSGNHVGQMRCERELTVVRKEIKDLTKQINRTETEEEKGGLLMVRSELIEKKREVRKAETKRKRRCRRRKIQKDFFKDPLGTSKQILSDKKHSQLNVNRNVINYYVKAVASDPYREADLGKLEYLPEVSDQIEEFDCRVVPFSKFSHVLKRKRNASKPGLNQIPYKVYKVCKGISKFLYAIIVSVLKAKKTPLLWRISDWIFIPKVDKPNDKDINDYRQIALLNVEGKMLWSLVGRRIYTYLVDDNSHIKTVS